MNYKIAFSFSLAFVLTGVAGILGAPASLPACSSAATLAGKDAGAPGLRPDMTLLDYQVPRVPARRSASLLNGIDLNWPDDHRHLSYKESFGTVAISSDQSLHAGFRKVSTTTLLLAATDAEQFLLDDRSTEKDFESIFNGKDLTGWTGDPRLWSVKDGAITGQTTPQNPAKGNTFLIWTNGTTGDFELRCSFKLAANNDKGFANSGIQYRSKVLDPANWVVGGYQADMEAGPTYTGILYEERMSRGIMAERGQKVVWDKDCKKQIVGSLGSSEELQKAIKQGDWNDYVIIAQGNHLQQFINRKQTVDVIDDCESKRAMNGVLALQLHAGQPMTAQFRNLRLKTLSGSAASADQETQMLQGTWQVASGQANGEAIPPETISSIVLTIKGNSYTAVINDQTDRGSFTLDSSKDPKQMDIHPDNADAGQLLGIYEIGPDTLRVCYSRGGATRPKTFGTAGDERLLLFEYKRKKE